MFKPQISEEERMLQEAKKRAARGKERLARMQNESQWNKGFHSEAIDKQIVEKSQRRNVQKQGEISYAKQMAKLAEESLKKEKEAQLMKIDALRKDMAANHIDPTQRDTFDINNPNLLRDTQPPRINDDDAVPVSCCQKFDGEDLKYADRRRQGQKLTKSTLEEQMEEMRQKKAAEKQADRDYVKTVTANNERLQFIESERNRIKQEQMNMVTKANQKTIIQHQRDSEMMKKMKAEEDEKFMQMAKSSKLLSERIEDTVRVDNPNRYIPYGFKGFGLEKTKEYYENRKGQVAEHEKLRSKQKEEEQKWANQQELQRKHLLKMELEKRQLKLQQRQQYANELAAQAKAQKEKLAKSNETFTNKVTEDFFNQFGTSHR